MNRKSANRFIESFKISIDKKSIMKVLKVNILFSVLTFIMLFVDLDIANYVKIVILLTLNVLTMFVLTRKRFFLYPFTFLISSINSLFTIIIVNIFYFSFHEYFDISNNVPFILIVLLQISFALIMTYYRIYSLNRGRFKTNTTTTHLTFSSFISIYIIIKFSYNPEFTSIQMTIASLGIILIPLVFIYYIFSQLLTRFALIVKYDIPKE